MINEEQNEMKLVMVVEDEPLLLLAVRKKLELSGMHVIACTSGEQAVSYLKESGKPPKAIWLDYYLKDMNGLEFMEVLKSDPKWESIPVIVVSNSASEDKVHSMLALGAKKYLLKAGNRLDDLVTTILGFVNENHSV